METTKETECLSLSLSPSEEEEDIRRKNSRLQDNNKNKSVTTEQGEKNSFEKWFSSSSSRVVTVLSVKPV